MEISGDCKPGWTKITAAVDSAAADNAMPEYLVPHVRTKETAQSRAGKVYRGAGGETIPNQGEKTMTVTTKEGHERRTTWQICPVKRALMSVAKITAAGNVVHLDEEDPHMRHKKSGQKIQLRKQGNVYVVDLWIKVDAPDFVRQGR